MVAYVLAVNRTASDMDGAGTDLASGDTVDLNGFKLTLDVAMPVATPYVTIVITDGSVAQTGTIQVGANVIMYGCSFDWKVVSETGLATYYLFSYKHNAVLGECYALGTGTFTTGLTQWNYVEQWKHDGTVVGAGETNTRKKVAVYYSRTFESNLNFQAGLQAVGQGVMSWNGHAGALSIEFDEHADIWTYFKDLFESNGIRFVANIASSAVGPAGWLTWAQIQALFYEGFDIGNHTMDHILMGLTLPQQIAQLQGCIDAIALNTTIPAAAVRTCMYPGGGCDQNTLLAFDTVGTLELGGAQIAFVTTFPWTEGSFNKGQRHRGTCPGWGTIGLVPRPTVTIGVKIQAVAHSWLRLGGHGIFDTSIEAVQRYIDLARQYDLWIATPEQILDYAVAHPTNRTVICGMETGLKNFNALVGGYGATVRVAAGAAGEFTLRYCDLIAIRSTGTMSGVKIQWEEIAWSVAQRDDYITVYNPVVGSYIKNAAFNLGVINFYVCNDANITVTNIVAHQIAINESSLGLTLHGVESHFFGLCGGDGGACHFLAEDANIADYGMVWGAGIGNGSVGAVEGGPNDPANEIYIGGKANDAVLLSNVYAVPFGASKWVHVRTAWWTFDVNAVCRKLSVYTGTKVTVGVGTTTTITMGGEIDLQGTAILNVNGTMVLSGANITKASGTALNVGATGALTLTDVAVNGHPIRTLKDAETYLVNTIATGAIITVNASYATTTIMGTN